MRTARTLTLAACLALTASANAVVIDFDALGVGGGSFTGVATEDGFTLDFDSMFISGDSLSTPDTEIERLFGTGGTLTVTRTDGGVFSFDSVDFEAERDSAFITLEGFLTAASVGSDTFVEAAPAGYSTYGASALAGVSIDTLVITAQRNEAGTGAFDTLVLTPAEVAEPVSLALAGAGMLLLAGSRRRR